jgi:hypothetical protein
MPARRVEVHRHVLALGEAVEHPFERELAADAALLVTAVGVAGRLSAALISIACAARKPLPMSWVQT